MNTIFLATSPLHIIISTLIASSRNKEHCHIILCGKEKKRNISFYNLINQWDRSPFSQTFALEHAKRPRDFEKIISNVKPDEVITGNDLLPEFFSVAHLASKHEFFLSYMDDGLYSYIEYNKKESSNFSHNLKNLLRRSTKGYKKPPPHTLGSSPLTKNAYLFYPELAKNNICKKTCFPIEISNYSISLLSSFGELCINALNLSIPSMKNDLSLFIIPHHTRMSTKITHEFEASILKSMELGMSIIIKNHPSNDNDIEDRITKNLPNHAFISIPKELPIELVICYRQPKFIMGGLSSIFLTTKAMNKNMNLKIIEGGGNQIPKALSEFLFRTQ